MRSPIDFLFLLSSLKNNPSHLLVHSPLLLEAFICKMCALAFRCIPIMLFQCTAVSSTFLAKIQLLLQGFITKQNAIPIFQMVSFITFVVQTNFLLSSPGFILFGASYYKMFSVLQNRGQIKVLSSRVKKYCHGKGSLKT